MHIVSRKKLLEFAEIHADAADSLDAWYRVAKSAEWVNLVNEKPIQPPILLVTLLFSISKVMTIG
jgi:mRNA interferase HigB